MLKGKWYSIGTNLTKTVKDLYTEKRNALKHWLSGETEEETRTKTSLVVSVNYQLHDLEPPRQLPLGNISSHEEIFGYLYVSEGISWFH